MINQSIKYNKLPSEILKIEDEYTAFCFDEACMYISNEIDNGKKPRWEEDELTIEESRIKTFNLAEQLRSKGDD
ncbi:hypothetical protein [Paraclostridium sordellii]|uniref:hypothetical protein n=1 Tax=Paraclostridium sordellii TaxID=1505 RepID=UPI0007092B5B|nr:hypothetical protein [Paeniclostridium sordellii]